MRIHRIDHIGINVHDLPAAKEFFLNLGLIVQGEMDMKGELLDTVTGLSNARTSLVWMGTPDGEAKIELVKFHSPVSGQEPHVPSANTPGIRHICFAVTDIESIVAKLKKKGVEMFSEIQNYEGIYKLCYIRGPEGMILELAEKIK